jgi:ATP-dependent DNA helicase RecG
MHHIELMPQILDIPSFNSETIREAVLNAMIHRSFQMSGDIFIRQYPDEITISNSGGFPYGVNLDNLLTVNSSPRSRLLTEVIEKTGLIERSGQGVDIMFRNCLMEGKALPDYSASDDYQVQLSISATVVMPYLALLFRDFQNSKVIDKQLNVFDMLTLYSIACHNDTYFYPNSIKKLLEEELIIPDSYFEFVLSDAYFKYYPHVAKGVFKASDIRKVYYMMQHGEKTSMSDFQQVFANDYTIKQTRTLVDKLVEYQVISREGKGKATHYKWLKSKNGEI